MGSPANLPEAKFPPKAGPNAHRASAARPSMLGADRRTLGLVLVRLLPSPTSETLDDRNVDVLFNDRLVACG